MMKLIDKSALVAKIKRLKKNYDFAAKEFGDEGYKDNVLMEQCKATVCKRILSFIDTLEVKEVPIWEKVSPDTGQTTLYMDGGKSYLERFGYRIDLKDLDKLPKKNLKEQKGE